MTAIDEFNTQAPRAAVMLSEVSKFAHVHFSFDALIAVEESLGAKFSAQLLFQQLDALNGNMIKLLATNGLKNCTLEEALAALTLEDLAKAMADALSLTYHGRPVADQVAKMEAEAVAEFERVQKLRKAVEAKAAEASNAPD